MGKHFFRVEVRNEETDVISLHWLPAQNEERFRSLGEEPSEFVDKNVLDLICLLDSDTYANGIVAWLNLHLFIFISADMQPGKASICLSGTTLGDDGQTYGFSRISGEEFASISGQLLVKPRILAFCMIITCNRGNLLPLRCLRSEIGDRQSRGKRGPNASK